MNYAVIYDSNTGNTKLLADHIVEQLGTVTCCYAGEIPSNDVNADIVFIGFWTDKGSCSESLASYINKLHHQRIALFGTAGFGGSPAYFQQILDRVKQNINEDCELMGTFMCQGKMPMGIRKRYEGLQQQQPGDASIKSFLQNFDEALHHPDQDDLQNLEKYVREITQKL